MVIPSRAVYEDVFAFYLSSPLANTVSLWRRLPQKEKLKM